MPNTALLARLQALGPLPDATTPAADDFPFTEFDELVQQLTAPLSQEHATALLNLGPPPGTGCHGVEWALIHAVDIASVEVLQAAVAQARDTEVTQTVAIRLANYLRQHP